MTRPNPAAQQEQAYRDLDQRFHRAAREAQRLWPGPVGELVSREINLTREFPFLMRSAYWRDLVADVLDRAERGAS